MSERSTLSVLIVEDFEEHVRFLTELLASKPETFTILVAATLEEARGHLFADDVDVVLLDLTLPDSEGLDTFSRMTKDFPNVPVVVLSGIQDVDLALETVQRGAQDYLVKGHVDNDLLTRSIQYAVERKRTQLQLQRANELLEGRVRERTEALQQANARLQQEVSERRKAEEAVIESNNQLAG